MKKLVLSTLVLALLAMQATGCTSSEGDDVGGDDVADATISATWSLHNLATAQANLPCPPGTTTAAVYTAPIDTDYNTITSETLVDLFDCDDLAGTTAPLFSDKYQTWIELTDDASVTGGVIDHGNVYTKSPVWPDGLIEDDREDIVDLTTASNRSIGFALIADGGYFQLGWSLQGNATCAAAGADGVSVLSTETASPANFRDDVFNCEAGFGITGAFKQGSYTVAITAIDSSEAGIGAPKTTTNTIAGPNRVTDLGDFVLDAN